MHLCKFTICLLVFICCFQFDRCLSNQISLSSPKNNQDLTHLDSQIDSDEGLNDEKLILSPFLNPGEILGYFNPGDLQDLDSINLVISKDGKTLFTLFNFDLLVYNTSNPAKPQQIGSLQAIAGWSVSMLLSPDEKTLYLYGNECLRVINVADLTSPTEIAFQDIETANPSTFYSQVISSDGKTLYTVNQECLNVWDVSEPHNPVIVGWNNAKYGGGIALTKNDTRIAVGLKKKFQILNAEDPKDLKVISSKNSDGEVYSIAFSDDENRVLLGVDQGKLLTEPYLKIYNITNLESPSLLVSAPLATDVTTKRLWFHSNEEYAFFTTPYEFKMIRIQDFQQITLFSSTSKTSTVPFSATPGNKINVVYASDNIIMMKFNIDIVPSSFVHFKPNALKAIDEVDYDRRPTMAVSKEGSNVFLVKNERYHTASIIPYGQSDGTSAFQKLNPVLNLKPAWGEILNTNATWDLIAGKNIVVATYVPSFTPRIFVIDITNRNASYELADFNYQENQRADSWIPAVALTGDDQRIIFINETTGKQKQPNMTLNILTLDQKELKNTLRDFKMPYSFCYRFSVMKISQDDEILFYANCDLLIYNLSDPSSPVLESQYNLSVSRTYGFSFSKDQKILYLFGHAWNGVKNLQIFSISDIKNPKLLSRVEIPLVSEGTDLVEISSDGKTLFLGFKDGILKVDVRVTSSPILFGYNYFLQKMDAEKFVTKNNMFYGLSSSGVTTFDITSEHILHLKNPNFKIGGLYLRALNVLKLNKNFKFDFMMKKHKFLKVSLFDNSISLNAESSLKTLPNWITFDQERSLLKIEPSSPSHNGTYKISVTLTTQTQPSAFIGLDSITNTFKAKELMLDLIHGGYIDNQGYISGDLDLNQELWINSKYQSIEKDIRAIFSENFIQAIGEIFVSSSLDISETKPLRISSLSKNTIHITIQFDQNDHESPRFLNKAHSSLTTIINSKSLLLLEGSLENVNEALGEIVVDFDGVCDGLITINDGINPSISHRIANLSNYFSINEKPENSLNNLQNQIDLNPFYTGLYSAMIINSSTFTDQNNLPLEYSLELEDPGLGLPPTWITLKGLSLMATPPESYTKFSYKFMLRVSNEFQSIAVPFTLKVKISFYYAVKLAFTFFGYTISLIGFVYSVNKAYNIVARNYYRHPRSFKLKVGEEINDTNLYPISFIRNEVTKSKTLFKKLERHVKQNYQCSLLEHFVDPYSQNLDQQKIIDTLKLVNDNETTDTFSIGTIQQLIINRLVKKQLSTKQETKTKQIYNQIKAKWMDLVISTPSSASQFIINSENLDKELSLLPGGESLNESHFEFSENLLNRNSLNIDLLASAIIAYAFSYQNVETDLIHIDVISYKKIKGRAFCHLIKEFLLKNMKPFALLNKREIGCGIEYKTESNTLHFFGRLTHELKNDTIIVHLKNHGGRILREFWIVEDNQAIESQQNEIQNVSETL